MRASEGELRRKSVSSRKHASGQGRNPAVVVHAVGGGVDRPREFVQGLERGLGVIRSFSPEAPRLTIAQVAERTGLTRASARRYLMTLESLGYVIQYDDRFSLTPKMLELGFTYLSTIDVTSVVQPFMEKVTDALHESCSVSVLDNHDIVYIARRAAKRIMSINLAVGSRLPAHATSMGKVLLAHLPSRELESYFASVEREPMTINTIVDERALRNVLDEVRENGWAVADEESELGVRSAAAPLTGRDGGVHAAINVSAHASRVSFEQLKRDYLPVLLDAARGISKALGADGEGHP
jgi:IclR family pca regulon transcriptional regulator